MSYILDALKRADAERERGAVPGLHSQPLTTTAAARPASAQGRQLGWVVLAVVALGGLAAGVWFWRATAQQAVTSTVAVTSPVIATPVPAQPRPATPVMTEPAPAHQPTPTPAPAPLPPLKPTPATPLPAPPKAALPVIAKPAASITSTAPNVPRLDELPPDLQRQIPKLTITGVVYSETPANRLLLLNNQVLTQGSLAAPEVTLEEIGPKSSVFSFRGTRFRLAH
ncbi:general secretion pathway protein GspB [Rhodoferax sp.]|uniref:general secretion pathway protein GspB n=1 Tax=Rhodoferax sp. TaxID=50421 RepID=UPI0028496507|nr:general secretion pathway protein GspB [Rhodoferax sp.]MDR3371899.1 general secretion pathway protein GspB [Rhodoferax sp.]